MLEKYSREGITSKDQGAQPEIASACSARTEPTRAKQADFKPSRVAGVAHARGQYTAQLEGDDKAQTRARCVRFQRGWGGAKTHTGGRQRPFQETLIRLPDTTRMKAVARIQEAQVNKLRADPSKPMRAALKIAGLPNPMGGWVSNISVMADSGSRWFNPDSKEYPVDVTLDTTPPGLKPGTTVEVKVSSNASTARWPCDDGVVLGGRTLRLQA